MKKFLIYFCIIQLSASTIFPNENEPTIISWLRNKFNEKKVEQKDNLNNKKQITHEEEVMLIILTSSTFE